MVHGKTTDEWHTDVIRVHTSDIRVTYQYIRVTYGWHTSTYEWHTVTYEYIKVTCRWHTSTYKWHMDDIRMICEWHTITFEWYTNNVRMTRKMILNCVAFEAFISSFSKSFVVKTLLLRGFEWFWLLGCPNFCSFLWDILK